jgi:hypothetical protein
LCDNCYQKCLGDIYYVDSKKKTGNLCSNCHEQRQRDLQAVSEAYKLLCDELLYKYPVVLAEEVNLSIESLTELLETKQKLGRLESFVQQKIEEIRQIRQSKVDREREQNRTEQNRTEQNRTEQNRTEQNRTEQNRTEQNRTEQNAGMNQESELNSQINSLKIQINQLEKSPLNSESKKLLESKKEELRNLEKKLNQQTEPNNNSKLY